MRVDVLTLFPAAFAGPLDVSIVGRARQAGLLDLYVHDIREHATDRHRSVDDYPFGGGQGMVMRVDVLVAALEHVTALDERPARVVYLTPQGRRLDDRMVRDLASADRLILVCGRYEGVDERFVEGWVDDEVSVGDFIVTGGELPAMLVIDAVARHLPGALGDEVSAEDESFSGGLLEHPHYTRPASFRGRDVPPVLLSGDHAAIERWRSEQRVARTAARRPDLLPDVLPERPARKQAGARIRAGQAADDGEAALALWREAALADVPATGGALERWLARDPELFVVAVRGRRLVGAGLAGWDGRMGHLYFLAVDTGERRKGLGRALLEELEARLWRRGCRRALAITPPTAEGRLFLEKAGWVAAGGTALTKELGGPGG
jgi:tRNA (guanine37-N1)-methyltransferase